MGVAGSAGSQFGERSFPCGGQKSLMAVTLFIDMAEALSFHNMLKSMIALRSLKNKILG